MHLAFPPSSTVSSLAPQLQLIQEKGTERLGAHVGINAPVAKQCPLLQAELLRVDSFNNKKGAPCTEAGHLACPATWDPVSSKSKLKSPHFSRTQTEQTLVQMSTTNMIIIGSIWWQPQSRGAFPN